MPLKALARRFLPRRLVAAVGQHRIARRERTLGELPLAQAFDEVYRRGMWKQGRTASGTGSEGVLAERYVAFVRAYAAKYNLRSVLDGGTGDFSIGSQLAPSFERYTAIDVSPRIIKINWERYSAAMYPNVRFMAADLTTSALPTADLVLIRQVLQHLTNAQIEMILRNLEASHWRRALITEDVHDPVRNPVPNLDLPSHTVRTRTSLGSGVFLDKPPFRRAANRLAIIYASKDGTEQPNGLLVLEMSRDG